MCGDCCRGFKQGEVYLYKDDILRLAKSLHMTGIKGLRDFAQKYVKVINESFFWKYPEVQRGKTYRFKTLGFAFTWDDERCHFLKNNKCTVHETRPFQCRCFPFWQMMVKSKKNVIAYSKKCPGLQATLRGNGKYYSRKEIQKWAKAEYDIEEKYFLEMKQNDFDILKVYTFLLKEMVHEDK